MQVVSHLRGLSEDNARWFFQQIVLAMDYWWVGVEGWMALWVCMMEGFEGVGGQGGGRLHSRHY